MPANKYALLRYRIIDRCLKNKFRPYPDKEDLRMACEEELYGSEGDRISLSTIDKDLYAMRNEANLGYYAPIAYNKAEKGYYYEDPDYSIDDFPLNAEDIEAIEFAANTLSQFRGIQLFESSGDAIDKILGRVSLRPETNETNESYLQFETPSEYKGARHLRTLLQAIRANRVVRFDYEKFTGESAKSYFFHPYLLKEYRNRWYVIGYNPEKQVTVVFGLDRIKGEVEITTETFVRNESFDPDLYFRYSLGITVVDEAPEKVVLRFSPLTAKYVESQPIHPSQTTLSNSAKGKDIQIEVCITRELIMQILSYGDEVEVISPESLRMRIAETLSESLDKYNWTAGK
jgi:predicted DNA-binding transcriptional regulator YafY